MQDRFKLRAWDKKSKKMRGISSIVFDDWNLISLVNVYGKDIIEDKKIILRREPKYIKLMQCTGEKVAHDTLLWEKDLVRDTTTDEIAVIEYEEGAFHLKWIDGCISECISGLYLGNLEKIGNVYENPEVLKNVEGGTKFC